MTKILITGSAGFVGSRLFKRFSKENEVVGISRRKSETTTIQLDLTSSKWSEALSSIKPEVIIHSAGLTNVDYCEINTEEAYNANTRATANIADWTDKRGAKLVYISTDYVYPGISGDYNEESEVNPVNFYGETKLVGEDFVNRFTDRPLILRPTSIFDYVPGDKNFLMQMVSLKESRRVPFDQISNPTYIGLLGDYIERALELDLHGTYVATGPESIDRLSFAQKILDSFGLDRNLVYGVKTSELGQVAKRPLNNSTNSKKLREALKIESKSLDDILREVAANVK